MDMRDTLGLNFFSWQSTWGHPSVVEQMGWIVEADVDKEVAMKAKEKSGRRCNERRGKPKVQNPKPQADEKKKFYCACMMVCISFPPALLPH